jgi:iron complex outermembrane receptor protein
MFMVTTPRVALMAPLRFDNVYSAWSQGVETVLRWNAARRWRSYWTHSWQSANFQLQPGKQVPTEPFDTAWQTPRNTLAWNTQYDINSRLETDLTLYAVSPVRGYTVPGYVRLDARIAYKIGEGAELSAGVRNLQEAGHLEFLAQDYTTSSEIRRGFYVRFRYRF